MESSFLGDPGTVALSPDGRYLCAGDDVHLVVWDLHSDVEHLRIDGTRAICRFPKDGRAIVASVEGGLRNGAAGEFAGQGARNRSRAGVSGEFCRPARLGKIEARRFGKVDGERPSARTRYVWLRLFLLMSSGFIGACPTQGASVAPKSAGVQARTKSSAPEPAPSCDGALELKAKASTRHVVFTLKNHHERAALTVKTRCRWKEGEEKRSKDASWRLPSKSLFPIFSLAPDRTPRCEVLECRIEPSD